ncbi:SURF1 family protein [Halopseudomonas pelagia]|uniref:SURF1 family protein n=1 Tax=Halopseudomonas pelagia TaxID=553151 RepID=UPI0030D72781|tara:strand:+ start:3343 stop:4080 length:738 start_codon:yes stop_codon:yes gene_type:complete
MSHSAKRFAPGWPLWIFLLAFLPLLVTLGFWQLERAEEKRQMQAQMDANRSAVAETLLELQQQTDPSWRPLYLQGQFDPERIWLLDNRIRGGQAGVEVLQIFDDQASGLSLIVNRGWIAWPDRRQHPSVSTPEHSVQLDAEALPGAEQGFTLGQSNGTSGWPKLISRLDLASMGMDAQRPLLDWTARLKTGSQAAFTLDWPALPMTASKHIAYAVQWFALAIALLALFIWAGFQPEHRGNNNNEQ